MISTEWLVNVDELETIGIIDENLLQGVCIYKAKWRKYQIVCVKQIRISELNEKHVLRELDTLSMCIHPRVCQYLGAGVSHNTNGYPGLQNDTFIHMVFEYMENGNLSDYIKRNTLTFDKKKDIIVDILTGMVYLSGRRPNRIVHRDLKPTNFLVNKHGEVKISDFGVSKSLLNDGNPLPIHTEDNETDMLFNDTSTSTLKGTLRWASPELLYENKFAHLSDIYSFGLVVYFIVTDGCIPYLQEYRSNNASIAFAKYQNIRPFLENPLIPDKCMLQLIKDCTEFDPFKRPDSAETILEVYFQSYNKNPRFTCN